MPNWCFNRIIVRPDPNYDVQDYERFKQTLNTVDVQGELMSFSLHQSIPRPVEQNANWYDWNMQHWGTKWDVEDPVVMLVDNTIEINCDTAWGPPDVWARETARIFHILIDIEYSEPGMLMFGLISASTTYYSDEYRNPRPEEFDEEGEDPEETFESLEIAC